MKNVRYYDDTDMVPRQMVIDALREKVEIPSKHPMRELGFWSWLILACNIIIHPFEGVRLSAEMTLEDSIKVVEELKTE